MSLISKGLAHLRTALLCFTYGCVGLEGHLSVSPCLLISREEALPFTLQVLLAEAPVLGAKAQSGDGKKESGHLKGMCRYLEVGRGEGEAGRGRRRRGESDMGPKALWAQTVGRADLHPEAPLPSALPLRSPGSTAPKGGGLLSAELGWPSWRALPDVQS